MVNVNMMNIVLFGVIAVFLIIMFFTINKNPSRKYWKLYAVNIVVLCFVIGSYFNSEQTGINSIFVPIVYFLVILLNLQQLIRALKSTRK